MIDAVGLLALARLVVQAVGQIEVFSLGLVLHPQAIGGVFVIAAARLVKRVFVGFQFQYCLVERFLN